MNANWEATAASLRVRAREMHEGREAGLKHCRALIQISSKCIRHVHRHQFDEAAKLLGEAKATFLMAKEALSPFPELYHAGFLHDAEKEMVEASAVLATATGNEIPKWEDLGTGIMSYLNGMGEAASELRRYVLDEMRSGRLESAEVILDEMERIYDELITFDFPDAMTGGLRRTCDALRAVIERTRSDLTTTASNQALVKELQETRKSLGTPDSP